VRKEYIHHYKKMSTNTKQETRAPNMKQKALLSILQLHKKESASKSIKQIWMTKDEEKRALDRLALFFQQHRYGNTHHSTHTNNKETEPINIICMDGGGMRGYCLLVMGEAIEKRSGGKDFLSRFDLAAGASAGGCGSICFNKCDNLAESISIGRSLLDGVREETLRSFNYMNFISSGTPVKKEKQIESVMAKRYGGTDTLLDEDGLNAFAVTARENEIAEGDDLNVSFHSPYLLRTYKVPRNDCNVGTHSQDMKETELVPPFKGTSDIPTWRAIGATSTMPIINDPIDYYDKDDDQNINLVDGGILFNCPLAIALEEAKRMFPNRCFGVILSLGLNRNQDEFAQKAIELAKKDSPNLHYQRISPGMGKYSSYETDEFKLKEMEQTVYDYTMNLEGLDETISKLFESESRRKSSSIPPDTSSSSILANNLIDLMIRLKSKLSSNRICNIHPSSCKTNPHNIEGKTSSYTDSETSGSDDQNSDNSKSVEGIHNHDVSILRSLFCCVKNRKKSIERIDSSTSNSATMKNDALDVFHDDSESL